MSKLAGIASLIAAAALPFAALLSTALHRTLLVILTAHALVLGCSPSLCTKRAWCSSLLMRWGCCSVTLCCSLLRRSLLLTTNALLVLITAHALELLLSPDLLLTAQQIAVRNCLLIHARFLKAGFRGMSLTSPMLLTCVLFPMPL